MPKHALIVHGGWSGHQPKEVAEIFRGVLAESGFNVEVSDTLDAFNDAARLAQLSLIVPIWTMGKIAGNQLKNVMGAVESGVGLAGCHGGMCDSFRESLEWQMMTGGQFLAHPGEGIRYTVNIVRANPAPPGPDLSDLSDFDVVTEQYYMLVDPAVKVLATTRPVAEGAFNQNGEVRMPVVWTKRWGKGRIFFSSLGHEANIVASEPALTIMRRGLNWAAQAPVA